MDELKIFFARAGNDVDARLSELVHENGRLHDAIRWSLFGGGKRFRPAILFAAGETFGAPRRQLVSTAAAVEMLHTYSLIHDDLPSMDDDDLRRGRQTCHRKFDESTAILAGDALQAKAFHTIACDDLLNPALCVSLLSGLGTAAARMVTGQNLDLEAEGKGLAIDEIKNIHANKTGALIEFSVVAGAMIGSANVSEINAMSEYGQNLGLLFQITDDLLDVTETTASLGKTAGKDARSEKATYPSVLGVEGTNQLADAIHKNAIFALQKLGQRHHLLTQIVEFIRYRQF
ncbi:MAG TPA: farnesyl diphosphate synthase [Pyrinomonadaceae bacterium]|nr:farnesyl diphosphate synthase [Pyrinomonadaceae bacterium]